MKPTRYSSKPIALSARMPSNVDLRVTKRSCMSGQKRARELGHCADRNSTGRVSKTMPRSRDLWESRPRGMPAPTPHSSTTTRSTTAHMPRSCAIPCQIPVRIQVLGDTRPELASEPADLLQTGFIANYNARFAFVDCPTAGKFSEDDAAVPSKESLSVITTSHIGSWLCPIMGLPDEYGL